jgi:hypothetical protein
MGFVLNSKVILQEYKSGNAFPKVRQGMSKKGPTPKGKH